jgi:hypothetical protein
MAAINSGLIDDSAETTPAWDRDNHAETAGVRRSQASCM